MSFALGVAITVAEPDLQVLAGNVPEIDTTVLILTVSVGVGFFLMLCMVRILFSISLRTMLIVFYAHRLCSRRFCRMRASSPSRSTPAA